MNKWLLNKIDEQEISDRQKTKTETEKLKKEIKQKDIK